eukprot:16435860-Heterocapsa_arctica.AAC.1
MSDAYNRTLWMPDLMCYLSCCVGRRRGMKRVVEFEFKQHSAAGSLPAAGPRGGWHHRGT